MWWVTLLAGGVYPWVWVPAAGVLLAVAIAVRAGIARSPLGRLLDAALVAGLVACLLQLVPLPPEMLQRFDPHAVTVRVALWLPPVLAPPDRPSGSVR